MNARRTFALSERLRWVWCVVAVCGLCLAWSAGAWAADEPVTRSYTLENRRPSEVQKILEDILKGTTPRPLVASDDSSGTLIVHATERVHRLVEEVLKNVDAPRPAPSNEPQRVSRIYACPPKKLTEVTAALRRQFPNAGVAPVVDTSQLVVLATPAEQELIAKTLRQLTGSTPTGGPATSAGSSSPSVSRVVLLRQETVDRVRQVLTDLFGQRLRSVPGRNDTYQFVNSKGVRAEVELDYTHRAVRVRGNRKLVDQFVRLVQLIDQPASEPGMKVRILPVRRANPERLREAVELYRSAMPVQDLNSVQTPGSGQSGRSSTGGPSGKNESPSGQSTKPPGQSAMGPTRSGLQPVGFFQEEGAAGQAGEQQPGEQETEAEEEAMRQPVSTVDIEALPDLDVLILRGREADVEELTRIIEEIERLSVEKQPQIDIVYLKHVRCDSLARLIQQVQDAWLGGRQGRVVLVPLVKPNALLLIGWGEAMEAIKTLIGKLDQPVQPSTQFKVFRLKHAPVASAQATISQFFANRGGLGPQVRLVPDPRTNSLLVEAAPRDMQEVALLIQQLDVNQSEAVMQTRIFRLKNTLAANTAQTIQAAIQAAAGGQPAQKAAVLELLTVDAEERKLVKSGLLSDVRIVPDVRTNSLIVTGPPDSMSLIESLINELDGRPAATAQIKVFRILNGDATAMVRILQTLLPTQGGASAVPQLPVAPEEEAIVPLRFAVDVRTNSIIATGSAGDLEIIEALLLRLDEADVLQRKNTVYRLKNAPANEVARALSDFLRSERAVLQAAPGAESPFLQIEREVVVVPEPVSNSLIISATPEYFDRIMKLIEELDAAPPQVLIQVLIAEVALGDADEFGVEAGIQDSVLFNRSTLSNIQTITRIISTPSGQISSEEIVSQEGNPGFNFINGDLGNNVARSPGSLGGQAVSQLGVGRLNSELGYGGLVLSLSNESISVLIRALQDHRRVDILSRPQIMTLDNQPAFIQVGERVPRIIGTSVNQVGQVNQISLENVGLILGVTPRISPDGMVVMEIDAEKSDLGTEAEGIPVSVSASGNVIRSPRVNITMAQTTVSAMDGQTVIIGGLITKRRSDISRRVPWLSDLPVLGPLFRFDSEIAERTELLIFLTPHVIRSQEEAERMKQVEAARMSWVASDVHELTGWNDFCQPGACPYCDGQVPVFFPDLDPTGSAPEKQTAPPPAPSPAQDSQTPGTTLLRPQPVGGHAVPASGTVEATSSSTAVWAGSPPTDGTTLPFPPPGTPVEIVTEPQSNKPHKPRLGSLLKFPWKLGRKRKKSADELATPTTVIYPAQSVPVQSAGSSGQTPFTPTNQPAGGSAGSNGPPQQVEPWPGWSGSSAAQPTPQSSAGQTNDGPAAQQTTSHPGQLPTLRTPSRPVSTQP